MDDRSLEEEGEDDEAWDAKGGEDGFEDETVVLVD